MELLEVEYIKCEPVWESSLSESEYSPPEDHYPDQKVKQEFVAGHSIEGNFSISITLVLRFFFHN